ncbi:MAG: hypothetical protein H0U66_10130 [Gemmatimonadaceae bacterium]|nr:hypothetical protein [Gemmatimonadaceae bacterium]
MLRLVRFASLAAALFVMTAAAPAHVKWPPWLSFESPVNPYDRSLDGSVLLVHAATRDGTPTISDVSGSAEGIVNGVRRSIPLKFDATSRPGVFALRKQWANEGTWLLRVSLHETTALVTLDALGRVSGVNITATFAEGRPIPRPVAAREIDSTLTVASAH